MIMYIYMDTGVLIGIEILSLITELHFLLQSVPCGSVHSCFILKVLNHISHAHKSELMYIYNNNVQIQCIVTLSFIN